MLGPHLLPREGSGFYGLPLDCERPERVGDREQSELPRAEKISGWPS